MESTITDMLATVSKAAVVAGVLLYSWPMGLLPKRSRWNERRAFKKISNFVPPRFDLFPRLPYQRLREVM